MDVLSNTIFFAMISLNDLLTSIILEPLFIIAIGIKELLKKYSDNIKSKTLSFFFISITSYLLIIFSTLYLYNN